MKWLVLIFLLMCIPFVTSNDDYVSYWKFDTNGKAEDIKNLNNGTITEAIFVSNCKYNGCYYYDGINDIINIPSSNTLNLTQNISISVWVKLNETTDWGAIGDNYNSGGYRVGFNGGNKIRFLMRNGVTTAQDDQYSTNALNLNEWYHVVVVYNGTNKLIYLNGSLGATTTAYTGNASGFGNLVFGNVVSASKYFNGSIDELRIYNRSLSALEVENLFLYNNESYCALANTSWSEWTNETDCLDNEHLHRHRNRTTYATVCTYAFTNVGFTQEQDIDCALIESQKINNNLIKIYEVFIMIAGILLFLGLWFLAYHMIQTGNMYMGWGMLLLSIPLDIFLSVMFQESNFIGSGFLGIAFSVIALFTLPAMILIKRKVKTL